MAVQNKFPCFPEFSCFPFYLQFNTYFTSGLFQQHYCYNVTGQSQESEGSCKPARIKEVHSKLHSFQASLCTLTAIYSFNTDICLHIHSAECTVRLLNQAGRNNYPYIKAVNTFSRCVLVKIPNLYCYGYKCMMQA